MTLVRLDSLINNVQDFPDIKDKLMSYRITINDIISELMKEKRDLRRALRSSN